MTANSYNFIYLGQSTSTNNCCRIAFSYTSAGSSANAMLFDVYGQQFMNATSSSLLETYLVNLNVSGTLNVSGSIIGSTTGSGINSNQILTF